MGKTIEAPRLYSDPKTVTLRRGKRLIAVSVPVSPEGVYTGNGAYSVQGDEIFRLNGFDWNPRIKSFMGRGWIITTLVGR